MVGSKRIARIKGKAQAVESARAVVAKVAVGYVRVSTDEQAATGFGLATQEAAIRAFAASQGYDLREVVTDAGVSGATLPSGRQGFGRVIELAAAGAFSVLLVWKFDRLARQIVYAVTAASDMQEKFGVSGAILPSGREGFGRVIELAEAGAFSVLLIWKFDRLARQIVYAVTAASDMQEIADELNGDSTPTARGGKWWPATVRYVLDNPKYRGQVEYLFSYGGKEVHVVQPGRHAPIVG